MVLSYQNHINRYEYDMNHTHIIDILKIIEAFWLNFKRTITYQIYQYCKLYSSKKPRPRSILANNWDARPAQPKAPMESYGYDGSLGDRWELVKAHGLQPYTQPEPSYSNVLILTPQSQPNFLSCGMRSGKMCFSHVSPAASFFAHALSQLWSRTQTTLIEGRSHTRKSRACFSIFSRLGCRWTNGPMVFKYVIA